jgi:histidyl-tRNA synthetase
MLTTRPRGTSDIIPGKVEYWRKLEEVIHEICKGYGFREIRTPIFEHTELFARGVGETTDIVEKEMYSFSDRGERNITLRPEGTAPTVRAFLENKFYAEPQPTKLYYIGPMFRYGRPQAGRFRQFHQFGVEVFSSNDPGIDAEVISLAMDYYSRLGISGLELHLNSVGCAKCRPVHKRKLLEHLQGHYDELCPTCLGRYEKNPLRIFDCKNASCQELISTAPAITDCLCDDCREHFEQVQKYLNEINVEYILDKKMVRGLDYYTKTAFEIMVKDIGAQSSIGGGGRYDRLVKECGGSDTPGIGFAMGLERIILTMEQQGLLEKSKFSQDVFIATVDSSLDLEGFKILNNLRREGISAEKDYMQRSLKSQLKYADKLGVSIVIIIGQNELSQGNVTVKLMNTGQQTEVKLNDLICYIKKEI